MPFDEQNQQGDNPISVTAQPPTIEQHDSSLQSSTVSNPTSTIHTIRSQAQVEAPAIEEESNTIHQEIHQNHNGVGSISSSSSEKGQQRARKDPESPTPTNLPPTEQPTHTGLSLSRINASARKKSRRGLRCLGPCSLPLLVFSILCQAATLLVIPLNKYEGLRVEEHGDISGFIPQNASGVILLASVTRIELERLEASITWIPLGCGSEYTSVPISDTINTPNWYSHFPLKNAGSRCGQLNKPVEITVNTGMPFRYDPDEDNYGFVKGSQHGTGAPKFAGSRTWVPSIATFNTSISLNPPFAMASEKNTVIKYPWDVYKILMRIWVNAPSSNSTEKGTAIPVVMTVAFNPPMGLRIQSGSWQVAKKSNGVVTDVAHEVLFLIDRHTVVKAFAVISLMLATTFALMMGWILIVAIWEKNLKVPKEVLLIPLTAILTIPQLRASMPGVPTALGISIDVTGYLLVTTTVTLCAIVTIFLMTVRQPLRTAFERLRTVEADAPVDHVDVEGQIRNN
ncbi:hypothetical protein FRC03_003336 [Tulasnella sp. 419]|nr:hypothetical protein FRC03_003336 [Tulasnella sp. 419]